jgi:hypothetical protein
VPTPNQSLKTAVSALGRSRRRALAAALAERRNHSRYDPAMADFYNALAAYVAAVTDDETAVLRRLQTDLDTPPAA